MGCPIGRRVPEESSARATRVRLSELDALRIESQIREHRAGPRAPAVLGASVKQANPHLLEPTPRIAGRILAAKAFAGTLSRAAFLSLGLASGLAGTGCADILGLDAPQELRDSSSQDRPDSATGGGMDSSKQDGTNSVKKDGATDSSPRDVSADIATDAREGGALTDQTC